MPSPVYQPCRFSPLPASYAEIRFDESDSAQAQPGRRCTTRSMSAKTWLPVERGPAGTVRSSSTALASASWGSVARPSKGVVRLRVSQPLTSARQRVAYSAGAPDASSRIAARAVAPSRWSPARSREIARPRTESIISPSKITGAKVRSTASYITDTFGSATAHSDPASRASRYAVPLSSTMPYEPV